MTPFSPLSHSLLPSGNPFLQVLMQGASQLQQAQQLRLARQQAVQRSATPPSGPAGVSPMQESIANAKNLVMSSVIGDEGSSEFNDLTDDQQRNLKQLRNDPNINLNQFEGLVRGLQSERQTKTRMAAQQKKETEREAPFTPSEGTPGGSMEIVGQPMNPQAVGMFPGAQVTPGENRFSIARQATAAGVSPRQMMVNQVKNTLHPDDVEGLTTAADDRQISESKLQSMIHSSQVRKAQQDRQATASAEAEKRRGLQGMRQDLMRQAQDSQRQQKEIVEKYKDVGGIEKALKFPKLFPDAAKDKAAHDQLATQSAQANTRLEHFSEGQLLHDPQTGKAYKIVNGQAQEVTGG